MFLVFLPFPRVCLKELLYVPCMQSQNGRSSVRNYFCVRPVSLFVGFGVPIVKIDSFMFNPMGKNF